MNKITPIDFSLMIWNLMNLVSIYILIGRKKCYKCYVQSKHTYAWYKNLHTIFSYLRRCSSNPWWYPNWVSEGSVVCEYSFISQHWDSVQNKIEAYPSCICPKITLYIYWYIGNEPYCKYKDPSHHPFHPKILSILFELKISDENIEKWKKEVIDGFKNKNWLGVNIDKVGSGYYKRYVDSRCVVSVID